MSNGMLLVMAALNVGVAIDQFRSGHIGMGVTFLCYGVACLGFIVNNVESA